MILNTSDELPVLTHLERVGPKGWLRYVFPFELPDNYDIDEVSRVLRVGYDAAAERLPVMACEAVPDTEAKRTYQTHHKLLNYKVVMKYTQINKGEKKTDNLYPEAGQLKLKKIPGDIDLLIIKDLRDDADAFPHSFAELKAKSFPVAALPAATLCPRPVWPRPGERLPVSLAQANFVRGGLVLAWNLFHMFGDSVTYSVWAQVWAEECRRAQGVAVPDPVVLPGRVFTDRARVMGPPSLGEIVRVEDHPEYILLPCNIFLLFFFEIPAQEEMTFCCLNLRG